MFGASLNDALQYNRVLKLRRGSAFSLFKPIKAQVLTTLKFWALEFEGSTSRALQGEEGSANAVTIHNIDLNLGDPQPQSNYIHFLSLRPMKDTLYDGSYVLNS